jgi:hypothetical protein
MADGLHRTRLLVRALWDAETQVWVATSEDIPGLVVEHESFEEMLAAIRDLAPDLISVPSNVKKTTTANAILKQAGLPKAF